MHLSTATRITLIVSAVVLVLGLAGLSVLSGAQLDLAQLLGALGALASGLLAGLGVAGGQPKEPPSGDSTFTWLAPIVILPALCTSACAPSISQIAPFCSNNHIVQIAAAFDTGLDTADAIASVSRDAELGESIEDARGAQSIVDSAMDACELIESGEDWRVLVRVALDALMEIWQILVDRGPVYIPNLVHPDIDLAISILLGELSQP